VPGSHLGRTTEKQRRLVTQGTTANVPPRERHKRRPEQAMTGTTPSWKKVALGPDIPKGELGMNSNSWAGEGETNGGTAGGKDCVNRSGTKKGHDEGEGDWKGDSFLTPKYRSKGFPGQRMWTPSEKDPKNRDLQTWSTNKNFTQK